MHSRIMQWLILALCSMAGMACSHQRGNHCSSSVASTPVPGACADKTPATCQSCPKSTPHVVAKPCTESIPVIAVKPCPCGSAKTYVMATPACAPCATAPKPTPVKCNTCGTATPAPVASCNRCAPGQATVMPGVLPNAPASPRVLAPNLAQTPSVEQPHQTAKPDDIAKAHRDPATGAIRYDHARDYSWVVGQLQYLHGKKQWRVRYSPYDIDDPFGGAVVITGIEHMMDKYKDGVTVRIQGQLVDPELRRSSPEYFVYDIRVLE